MPSTPREPARAAAPGSPVPGSPAPEDGRGARRTVSLVTLGCARNEVDSEELAARLAAGGWELAADGEDASVVMVNTCGFIQAAKQESIDELLGAAESGAKVAAVGCLAERYGSELADALPEAQILSFDDYGDIASRLDDVLSGRRKAAHTPRDRRTLLPISPADRPAPHAGTAPAPPAPAPPAPPGTVPPPAPCRHRAAGWHRAAGRECGLGGRDGRPACRAGPAVRAPDDAPPPVARGRGAAQDRLWL